MDMVFFVVGGQLQELFICAALPAAVASWRDGEESAFSFCRESHTVCVTVPQLIILPVYDPNLPLLPGHPY